MPIFTPKKEKIKISLAVLAIFALVYIFFLTSHSESEGVVSTLKQATNSANLPGKTTEIKENMSTAILEVGDTRYGTVVSKNMNVYGFMKKLQTEGKINFKDKTYSGMGKLIEEINGIKNSGDKNWIYYVNNKKAQIGVSNYKIDPGDVVSWKYEKDIN